MHEARARERHDARLLIAPRGQRRGPLACATRLVGLLAAVDQAAIDESGDDRRQLPRQRRDHGLVQLAEPFQHALLPDQIPALIHQGDREQIGDRRSARRSRPQRRPWPRQPPNRPPTAAEGRPRSADSPARRSRAPRARAPAGRARTIPRYARLPRAAGGARRPRRRSGPPADPRRGRGRPDARAAARSAAPRRDPSM